MVSFLGLTVGCSDDDGPSTSDVRLTGGFVFTAFTPGGARVVEYLPQFPTGTADLSNGITLEFFNPGTVYNGALYGGGRINESKTFVKYGIDGNEELVDDAEISREGEFVGPIRILNDTLGVFQGRGNVARLTFFDPRDMTSLGSIDIIEPAFPSVQRTQSITRRGDLLFLTARPNTSTSYDQAYVQVVNVATGDYEGFTSFDVAGRVQTALGPNSGNTVPNIGFFGLPNVDEQGNIWVLAGADPIGGNSVSSILKIPAGSTEFDPNYFFTPALVANPGNTFFPATNTELVYIGNGQALACVATTTPQELIEFINDIGGPQNLTTDELRNQALDILFRAENARWSILGLEDQTVTAIEGVPSQSPVAAAYAIEQDGDYYLSVQTNEINAYYRYDGTNATKAFDVIGGNLGRFYNLSQNN